MFSIARRVSWCHWHCTVKLGIYGGGSFSGKTIHEAMTSGDQNVRWLNNIDPRLQTKQSSHVFSPCTILCTALLYCIILFCIALLYYTRCNVLY